METLDDEEIEALMLKILIEGKPVKIFDSVRHTVNIPPHAEHIFVASKLPDTTNTCRRFINANNQRKHAEPDRSTEG